ncbi:MAG TPA: hypothetical protein ENK28_12635 [Aliiroseovarius sp.]|nr:hypothetical protein [Aliiroseovarius sp.]
MELTEITYDDAVPIDGYGPGFFRVDGKVMNGAVLVTADAVRPWDGLEDVAPLLALAGQVDIVILGLGADMPGLPADLIDALEQADIGVEVMASPNACRTYNVLLAEGRRIALAALPV